MVVECAWCGCIVGQKDGLGLNGTTSGICVDCFATILEQIAALERRAAREAETVAAGSGRPTGKWPRASRH